MTHRSNRSERWLLWHHSDCATGPYIISGTIASSREEVFGLKVLANGVLVRSAYGLCRRNSQIADSEVGGSIEEARQSPGLRAAKRQDQVEAGNPSCCLSASMKIAVSGAISPPLSAYFNAPLHAVRIGSLPKISGTMVEPGNGPPALTQRM